MMINLVVVTATIPNIWSIDEAESNEDSNDEDDHETSDSTSEEDETVVSSSIEEDLEKPSFLRRLSKEKEDSEKRRPVNKPS